MTRRLEAHEHSRKIPSHSTLEARGSLRTCGGGVRHRTGRGRRASRAGARRRGCARASCGRHAQDNATRLRALARVTEDEELLNVALKAEHTDVAVAALERIDGTEALAAISQRARNKVAARRARTKLRAIDEPPQAAPDSS